MRVSILIVVTAVVILIIAVVMVTIFGGGIEKFLQIWGGFSEEQLAHARCQTKCQELCANWGKAGEPTDWAGETVVVGNNRYNCKTQTSVKCDCSSLIPGVGTQKRPPGADCEYDSDCQSNDCDDASNKCK